MLHITRNMNPDGGFAFDGALVLTNAAADTLIFQDLRTLQDKRASIILMDLYRLEHDRLLR